MFVAYPQSCKHYISFWWIRNGDKWAANDFPELEIGYGFDENVES